MEECPTLCREIDPVRDWRSYRALVKFFKKEKFPVVVCPWINEGGTVSLGRLAAKEKLFGMLETTWHISHDLQFRNIYGTAAASAWNPDAVSSQRFRQRLSVSHHLRQIGWDMGVSEYEKTGFSQYQVDPGHHPHQLT